MTAAHPRTVHHGHDVRPVRNPPRYSSSCDQFSFSFGIAGSEYNPRETAFEFAAAAVIFRKTQPDVAGINLDFSEGQSHFVRKQKLTKRKKECVWWGSLYRWRY